MAHYRCRRCQYLYKDEYQEQKFEELNEEIKICPRCNATKKLFDKLD